ncbi:MAG: aspartate kinase, partial [Chitinophagales bacterium]
MRIFKFGGASIKDAQHIKNVVEIIKKHSDQPLVVVISAMGKITNAMEEVVQYTFDKKAKEAAAKIDEIKAQHLSILRDLFGDKSNMAEEMLLNLFEQVYDVQKFHCHPDVENRYNRLYDKIVPFGELVSTTMVNLYLKSQNFKSCFLDVRTVIKTEEIFREGKVLWDITQSLVEDKLKEKLKNEIVITQGFLGGTINGVTTTLGREGSDYTAAILAYCLNADSVTIWKDVAGVLNADPKMVKGALLLENISYSEALELAYAGATVIHPKTIRPLQSKNIPLRVFSFYNPEEKGTIISKERDHDKLIPSIIFKQKQVLLKLKSKDFSFITEQNLSHIFGLLSEKRIKANMMQLTAADFSVCVNEDRKLSELCDLLAEHYDVKSIENLRMITIRHYNQEAIDNSVNGQKVMLSEKL